MPLIHVLGPSSTAWLRLLGAACALWAVARPALSARSRPALAEAIGLGIASAGMSTLFLGAIARIPLGLATAIEFIGPLAVAIAASRRLLDAVWAALAGAGVVLLTLKGWAWSGDPLGIGLAACAAACFGAYIVLTKRVGQAFEGLQGLTVSLTAAALAATPLGLGSMRAAAPLWAVAAAMALGLLSPVLPFCLELLALRRMSAQRFGILTSADPAVSALVGWIVLGQTLDGRMLLGIACVVAASLGAIAASSRSP